MVLHNKIFKHIAESVKDALDSLFSDSSVELNAIYNNIWLTPNHSMGCYALPCFIFAKQLKQSPSSIAQLLCEKLNSDEQSCTEAFNEGPYLNINLSLDYLGKSAIAPILSGEYFNRVVTAESPKTMIEYSQPNTHKELHVGHMRNLCLGNALVNIKRYCNQDILTATYPGDVGTHVAKCLWYMEKHIENMPQGDIAKAQWLGAMYVKANKLLKEQENTDLHDTNRLQLSTILKQIESKDCPYYELWQKTRAWSLALMKHAYYWSDVDFDHWFYESQVDSESIQIVEQLFEAELLVNSEGAIGIDLSDEKLGFCLLLKKDGTGLYATKDIALAKRKFEMYGVQNSIYIVDNRQSFHFNQVFKTLEKIGFKQAKNCIHLDYEMVELPDGAMSSRKGNIVPLLDLIHEMEVTIKERYLNKHKGIWSDEQIDLTATQIANAAIKYGMTKQDKNRKIVFDMDEWLRLDGDTGPYLQYIVARINSLITSEAENSHLEPNYQCLLTEFELKLLLKLTVFNDVALSCHEKNQTSILAVYLYELGKLFNRFYTECPIKKAQSEELKQARMALARSTGAIIQKGLALLGIESPARM